MIQAWVTAPMRRTSTGQGRGLSTPPGQQGPDALPRGEAAALARRERQAAALRENLARRKAQGRLRKGGVEAAPQDSGG